MEHERLKHMKETLMCAVEAQLCNIEKADTQELGEAIDMIKDLEEALYYSTVTKAMEGNGWKKGEEENGEEIRYNRGPSNGRGSVSTSDSTGYMDGMMRYDDSMPWDVPEGKSPKSRVMYMEPKEKHADKASQLRELEKYMQELSQDMVDMIDDASPEEKQYLEKKLTALATKIGQMK